MTQVEKIARLMGYEVGQPEPDTIALGIPHTKGSAWVTKGLGGWVWFNPLTNKADLMDVECALGIDVLHDEECITAEYWQHGLLEFDDKKRIANYAHNKFTARATAVINVAEQIYDKQYCND